MNVDRDPINTMNLLNRQTRKLSPAETKVLEMIRANYEKIIKKGPGIYPLILVIAIVLVSICLAIITSDRSAFVLFCITAVLFSLATVGMVLEILRPFRNQKKIIEEINRILDRGTVDVYPVRAKRIAIAKEYEDESDLYIIEMENDHLLYLRDHSFTLSGIMPCLEFEIYSNDFGELVNQQIVPLTNKIVPVVLDARAMLTYLLEEGFPEHMTIENGTLDELIERINNNGRKSV